MFSLICARINGWVNNGEAGDLRRHCAHYDVTVMERQNGKSINTIWKHQFSVETDVIFWLDIEKNAFIFMYNIPQYSTAPVQRKNITVIMCKVDLYQNCRLRWITLHVMGEVMRNNSRYIWRFAPTKFLIMFFNEMNGTLILYDVPMVPLTKMQHFSTFPCIQ